MQPAPAASVHDVDRIWIVGSAGSGKSTLAKILATLLDVEATQMDDLHWLPGWVERPARETATRLARIAGRDRWVIDGNYSEFRAAHVDRIDLTIWLDLPLRVTFPRLVRRSIRRSLRKEPCCNGNYESLWRTFLHRESLLLYTLRTHGRRRRQLQRALATRPHVRLRSSRAVRTWLGDPCAHSRTG